VVDDGEILHRLARAGMAQFLLLAAMGSDIASLATVLLFGHCKSAGRAGR
jgi:hypothetical protein